MLATPTVYCLTPSRAFSRTPARATTLIRDIKRKSMRMKRSCSFRLDTTPGRFVQLDEEEIREAFKSYDQDGDGYITRDEMFNAITQMGFVR